MRCKHCNAKLATHDLWCVECGRQTEVVKKDLAAMKSLGETYRKFFPVKASSVPGAAFSLILGVIPVVILVWLFSSIISLESNTATQLILSLIIKSVSLSVFIPFALLGFNVISTSETYQLTLPQILGALKAYPRYFRFSLISALYYIVLYLICWGFPGFSSLPILRLVWLVMVAYWIAIILPAPVVMERTGCSPLKAVRLSYQHFHDVRWNIFLLALVLTAMNLLAFIILFVPMIISLPLSLYAIRDYTNRLIEYELLDYRR